VITVRVVYEVTDPLDARIDGWLSRTAPVFLPAIGAIFTGSMALLFRKRRLTGTLQAD
jgi:hypothetical protein